MRYFDYEMFWSLKNSKVYDGCSGTSVVAANVLWLIYCRYGVKLYPINQSTNQSINQSVVASVFVVSSEELSDLLAA